MFLKIKNLLGVEERISTQSIVSYLQEPSEEFEVISIYLSNGKKVETTEHTIQELDLALNECYLFVKDVPKIIK